MTTTDAPEGRDAATVAAIAAGVIGVALTIGALAAFGSRTALSVGIGATIAVANLVTMRAIVRNVLRPTDADGAEDSSESGSARSEDFREPGDDPSPPGEDPSPPEEIDHAGDGKRGGAAWGAFGIVKIAVLFGGIYLLLTRGMVDPMPLVVGYGVLPLGIAASTLFTGLAPRPKGPRRRPRPRHRQK
jgi:hypothetical protein